MPIRPLRPSRPDLSLAPERRESIDRRAEAIAELKRRIEQRLILCELTRTHVLLAGESLRDRRKRDEEERRAAAEREWLRSEAAAMLDAGWTPEELREIGFGRWLPARERAH